MFQAWKFVQLCVSAVLYQSSQSCSRSGACVKTMHGSAQALGAGLCCWLTMQHFRQHSPLMVPPAFRRLYAQPPCILHGFGISSRLPCLTMRPHTCAPPTSCRQLDIDQRCYTCSQLLDSTCCRKPTIPFLSAACLSNCWVRFQGVLTHRPLLFRQL